MKQFQIILLSSVLGFGLVSCQKASQSEARKVQESSIQPAKNKMNILPSNFRLGTVLINPPRAKDGFGPLSTQTIGSYNGLYKLLKDNGLTLGNVMRIEVKLVADENGNLNYDEYMAEYKKFFGTKKVPVEPIHSIAEVKSLATPGQLILLEADIAVPIKQQISKEDNKKDTTQKKSK